MGRLVITIARGYGLPVVHQPEQEIGRIAATYLIERLNGYAGEPRMTRLKCKISRK